MASQVAFHQYLPSHKRVFIIWKYQKKEKKEFLKLWEEEFGSPISQQEAQEQMGLVVLATQISFPIKHSEINVNDDVDFRVVDKNNSLVDQAGEVTYLPLDADNL